MEPTFQTPQEATDALNKAKIQLMSTADSVFFTTLAFSLKHSFSNSIPTACTNGKSIKYNPDFFMGLTPDERVFLILHEAMHCAYLHMERKQDRCPDRFNIAADHVINLQLIERGFRMPADGYADPQYKGLSTEEVYNLLPPPLPNQPMGGFGNDLEDPEDGSAASSEALRNDIQDILVRAAIQSKLAGEKPGSIPGDIQIFLDRLLNPKLPWNRILQKYLNQMSKSDYTFKRLNRRFFPRHYLPSLYSSERLINIAVAIDTSGSVSDEEFNRFISETHYILKTLAPEKITIIQFDTEIKSVDDVSSVNDLMKVHFSGRGGTMIKPVFDWATENKPQLLLVFTDGEFRIPDDRLKMDTLWLIHGGGPFNPHFGKIIRYET